MKLSLDFQTLSNAYAISALSPLDLVEELISHIERSPSAFTPKPATSFPKPKNIDGDAIVTGLATLGLGDVDWALEARPASLVHVTDAVAGPRIAGARTTFADFHGRKPL